MTYVHQSVFPLYPNERAGLRVDADGHALCVRCGEEFLEGDEKTGTIAADGRTFAGFAHDYCPEIVDVDVQEGLL